jgi:hypothetical protein
MSRNHRRRLERLEACAVGHLYQDVAEEFGISAAELQRDTERFMALPIAQQIVELDELIAALEADGDYPNDLAACQALRAQLLPEVRP